MSDAEAARSPLASHPPEEEPAKTEDAPGLLATLGLAGDFGHLNTQDPFHIKLRGTDLRTEIRAGVTSFLAIAYILPVNSSMLSQAIPGMKAELLAATAMSAIVGSTLMGCMCNYPFVLAPGMGTNAFFTFTVVLKQGMPWESALAAVFCAGCIFIILSITGARTMALRLFPPGIRAALGPGVGLFLTFISFQESNGMGLSVDSPATLVQLNSLRAYDASKIWLSLSVLLLTSVLMSLKVPGSLMAGISFGTVVCWIEGWSRGRENSQFLYPFGAEDLNSTTLYAPDGVMSLPSFSGLAGALFKGFDSAFNEEATQFWIAVLTFCYTDLLDSTGTFFAVVQGAGLADADGRIPLLKQNMAYLSDATSTVIGAILGVSTVTTVAESLAGVADGGKTGVVSLTCAAMFFISIFFEPIFSAIPPMATGPILLIVGSLMFSGIKNVEWADLEESIPAFVAVVTMPFTFNIGYGIIAGIALWLMMQLVMVPVRYAKGEDPFVRMRPLCLGTVKGISCKDATASDESSSDENTTVVE